MGKEAEMKNGTILAMIEKKLPEEIRFDWVKTIAEKTRKILMKSPYYSSC